MVQSNHFFSLVCSKRWLLSVPGCLNDFRQIWHSNCFTLLWDSMWISRAWSRKNDLLHSWHKWFLVLVWSSWCDCSVFSPENIPLHWSHGRDIFSWVLMWLLRPSGCVKAMIHLGQLKFLFPLCKYMCFFRLCGNPNILPHCLHSKFFSPLCINKWDFKWSCLLNDRVHSLHVKGLGPKGSVWVFLCFTRPPQLEQSTSHTQQIYVLFLISFLTSIFVVCALGLMITL